MISITQPGTLALAILAQLLLLAAIRLRIIGWRYTILPGMYLMATTLFYAYLFSPLKFDGVDNAVISAWLRFYEHLIIVSMLASLILYKRKRA